MAKLRLTVDEFAERVNKATNNRISIVKETYTGTRHKVTAYCNVHKIYFDVKEAKRLYEKHIDCPICTKERSRKKLIKTWKDVYDSFINKYGNKFSYDETTYNGTKELMKVHCNDCGEDFEITPEHHLKYNNGGCPNCHKTKIMICENCGKEFEVDRHYNVKNNKLCKDCRKEVRKNRRRESRLNNSKNSQRKRKRDINQEEKHFRELKRCLERTKNKLYVCPFCGQTHHIKEKCLTELCNQFQSIKDLLKLIPFGFDYSTIGTIKYIDEFNKVAKLLSNEYFSNKLSPRQIYEKYKCQEYFNSEGTLRYFLKYKLHLHTRTLSEALHNAIDTGVYNFDSHSYQFKTEYHTSWEGKTFLLRSSYETDFANILDEQHTPYEVEALRIRYFDTQQQKERIAIPDFYLPETNTIIEVKSSWTFDKQNMLDKRAAYHELGYDFKLWYEHEFVDLDTFK